MGLALGAKTSLNNLLKIEKVTSDLMTVTRKNKKSPSSVHFESDQCHFRAQLVWVYTCAKFQNIRISIRESIALTKKNSRL